MDQEQDIWQLLFITSRRCKTTMNLFATDIVHKRLRGDINRCEIKDCNVYNHDHKGMNEELKHIEKREERRDCLLLGECHTMCNFFSLHFYVFTGLYKF